MKKLAFIGALIFFLFGCDIIFPKVELFVGVLPTDSAGVVFPIAREYSKGQKIELEAVPSDGWIFSHWSGDVSGSTPKVELTMDADKAVYANFTEIADTGPTAHIDTPAGNVTIAEGESVNFTGSASGGTPPYSYSWTFAVGSGIIDHTGEDPGSRQFDYAGTYAVQLTVTDSDSKQGSATRTITVIPPAVKLVIYLCDEFTQQTRAYMVGSLMEIAGSPFANSLGTFLYSGQATSDGRFFYGRTGPPLNPNPIVGFEIDRDTGALTEIGSTAMTSNDYWLISPDDKYIFTCGPDAGDTIYRYDIDQTTGELVLGGTYDQDLPVIMEYPVVTPDSQFLYVSYNFTNIAGFQIGTDGALTQLSPFTTTLTDSNNPEHLIVHPDGTFLLVETSAGVKVFAINQTTGALTALDYSPVIDLFVRNWTFHPDGEFLFNPDWGKMGIYAFDSGTGALTETGNNITDFKGAGNYRFLSTSPDGSYLFAVNNNTTADEIAIFEFDPLTGTAAEMGDSPYGLGDVVEWTTQLVVVELPPATP